MSLQLQLKIMKNYYYATTKVIITIKIILIIQLCIKIVDGIDYENTFGDDYGQNWVLMTDVNGDTHYIDLTQLPLDQSRMTYGDVYFHLYTRDNPNNYEELYTEDDGATSSEVLKSYFLDSKNDVKFITHGWMSGENATIVQSIKDAYLRSANLNVIGVDWHELSENVIYPWAAFSTRYVGRRIADMITRLTDSYNISGYQIHLIGHSLGAHVMGFAGSFSNENISRITGLDPARPFFEIPYFGPSFSLDESDASFVDVVHTCGGILGYRKPTGTADFFPNNGYAMQPGCKGMQPVLEACSHGRAFELFAESIESENGFVSYPCDSWESFEAGECTEHPVLMGDHVQDTASGSYYLYTNSEPKYAIHDTNNNE